MPLPTTWLALPHVDSAGNQGSHLAACTDPKIRGLFRCRQFEYRTVRAHDVPGLQRCNFPELSQAPFATKKAWTAHDFDPRQCPIPSRPAPETILERPHARFSASLSAAL